MAKIGIICGMASEMRTLGFWADHPDIVVGVSGAQPDRASAIALRMRDEDRVELLVSWGIAGGLDPSLNPGDVIVPDAVVTEAGARHALVAGQFGESGGRAILGADKVITSVAEKAALWSRMTAVGVDMETHRVAQVASDHVPCVAVRAISDPAGRALPAIAADALDPEGKPRIGRVIRGLALRPWELPGLLAAKRDSEAALAGLSRNVDEIFRTLLNG